MINSNPPNNAIANNKQPDKNQVQQSNFQLILQNLETTNRRLKLSEEKQTLISRKFELLEQNLVNFERATNQKISNLNEQVQMINKELNELKETVSNILETLKNVADKNTVKEIEKYLELWNPVKFATIDDVRRIVNEERTSVSENKTIKKDLNKLFFNK
ncbi:MAG: hypothetical protein PWP03_851 [Candidatus Woesearchaeota archaeon]|nr:hypothetical protein [Candidatus Woesearchaeota archaeon]MDN5328213.1 hypothetical protein [Candidatus Woesearchaeota archaeon]